MIHIVSDQSEGDSRTDNDIHGREAGGPGLGRRIVVHGVPCFRSKIKKVIL